MCPVLEMARVHNVQGTMCPVFEMARVHNVQGTMCPVFKMASALNWPEFIVSRDYTVNQTKPNQT